MIEIPNEPLPDEDIFNHDGKYYPPTGRGPKMQCPVHGEVDCATVGYVEYGFFNIVPVCPTCGRTTILQTPVVLEDRNEA